MTKDTTIQTIGVGLPRWTWVALTRLAEEKGLTRNALIRLTMERELNQAEKLKEEKTR